MDVDDFSAFPVQRSCQCSRDRCCAHTDIMNAFLCLLFETLTLLYAESVLLVHNRKTQFFELDLIGKDRMCTDHNIRLTRSDFRKCCLLFPDFHAAVQEHGSVPELCEEIRKIIIVLSGQYKRRTHYRTLISVHSHTECCDLRYDSFAATDITLNESIHTVSQLHLFQNMTHCLILVFRQCKRQFVLGFLDDSRCVFDSKRRYFCSFCLLYFQTVAERIQYIHSTAAS